MGSSLAAAGGAPPTAQAPDDVARLPAPRQSAVSLGTSGTSAFVTSLGTYRLGAQTDAQGRPFAYARVDTWDVAAVTPAETGWYMTPGSPQAALVALPAGVVEAELVGTFVQRAGSDVYDPLDAYEACPVAMASASGAVTLQPQRDGSVYPGTRVDASYAYGGRWVTIPTLIGPQTLLTDATVTFAYLLKEKTWSGP